MKKLLAQTLVIRMALLTSLSLLSLPGHAWAQEPTAPEDALPEEALPEGAAPDDGHDHGGAPAMMYPDHGGQFPEAPLTVSVLGHEVLPKKGLFEVTTDLNVRSGPGTNFDRVEGLKAGDRVRVLGKSEDGDWLAISKDGVTLGFAYAPILIAVVDGTLTEPFVGSYTNDAIAGGIACDYRFRFERKSDVEGESFQTADYEVRFRCAGAKSGALFYAHMFLTEGPVNENDGLHLIGLDVRSIGDGMLEFLSTSYLYNPKTGKMTFDGHTLPQFALPPKVQTFKTASVKDALKQALEASVASWTPQAWAALFAKKE